MRPFTRTMDMTAPTSESPLVRRVRALGVPRCDRDAALIELALAERFADDAAELGQLLATSLARLSGLLQGSAR